MQIIGCPEDGCDMPSEVIARQVLESTDGPVEHVKIRCLAGHWYFMPVDRLET